MQFSFVDAVGVLGAIVSIATFAHQFAPGLKKRMTDLRNTSASRRIIRSSAADTHFSEPKKGFWIGLSFAVLALLLWSISHVTFRTPEALEVNPVFLSGIVLLLGGLFSFIISLLVAFSASSSPAFRSALSPMLGWRGIILIVSGALEAVFYVMAMQLIQAAQVMALWKSNALWVLCLLLIFSDERVRRVSIASTFCVLAGVIYIVRPTISLSVASDITIFGVQVSAALIGSILAIVGGLFFAIYSVAIHFYPISSEAKAFPERIALQSVILSVAGAGILAFHGLRSGFSGIEPGAWSVVVFNAFRLGIVYICYAEAIKRTRKPLLVACILALEIPLTMYLEHLWIGGVLNSAVLYGGLIIVVGAISILREHQYLPRTERTAQA